MLLLLLFSSHLNSFREMSPAHWGLKIFIISQCLWIPIMFKAQYEVWGRVGFMVHRLGSHAGPRAWLQCSAVIILKFLSSLEQEALHFHSALGPTHYVVGPVMINKFFLLRTITKITMHYSEKKLLLNVCCFKRLRNIQKHLNIIKWSLEI